MKDQAFLNKAFAIVTEHFRDPDFNVKAFAACMGISRIHLSRRLKALCGLSASAFLRETRLSMAAKMLSKEEKVNITEVAYDVVFGSHAYFSKCFGNRFNITPREYQKGG